MVPPTTCWRKGSALRRRAIEGTDRSGIRRGFQARRRDGGTKKSHDVRERQRPVQPRPDRRCVYFSNHMRNGARDASSNPRCCGAASARGRAGWQRGKTSGLVFTVTRRCTPKLAAHRWNYRLFRVSGQQRSVLEKMEKFGALHGFGIIGHSHAAVPGGWFMLCSSHLFTGCWRRSPKMRRQNDDPGRHPSITDRSVTDPADPNQTPCPAYRRAPRRVPVPASTLRPGRDSTGR